MGYGAMRSGDFARAEALEREALAYLDQAIAMNPEDIWSMSNAGDALKDLALISEGVGDFDRAREIREQGEAYFNRALSSGYPHPQFPVIYFKTGALLVDGGDYERALPYLENAVQALPDHAQAQYVLGFTYNRLSDWEKAARHLEASLRLEANVDAVIYLADTYRAMGRIEQAFGILGEGARVFQKSAEIHYNLGILHESIGRPAMAREEFSRALELAPTGALAVELKRRLEAGQVTIYPRPPGPG
jgi:tetratricopeptide (TPR) repeat protein